MKSKLIIIALLAFVLQAPAQDSTKTNLPDSIGVRSDTTQPHSETRRGYHWHDWDYWRPYPRRAKPTNLSTNWFVVDLGFANYNDKTNYADPSAQAFAPGSSDYWFSLKNNKSVNVNIYLFMQRLNLIKHVVNLKYGFGIELNNYRYSTNIKYHWDPTTVVMDTVPYSKNKLAADYFNIPLMLNFNFTPGLEDGFGLSVGVSAGYLYSSRQKLVSDEFGKHKYHDDFDLRPWKLSWVAELLLGPIKFYGSYATQSMFKKGLDQTPYTVGIRLSKW
ncbi:MAG TPA: outer membrane beta-barrel protein [Puia sp.]|nr:outer membrane beta-barrel protein [Puia sp.]